MAYKPGGELSPQTAFACTIILDFQLPELGEINVCFCKPPSLWYFVMAVRSDYVSDLGGKDTLSPSAGSCKATVFCSHALQHLGRGHPRLWLLGTNSPAPITHLSSLLIYFSQQWYHLQMLLWKYNDSMTPFGRSL